MARNFGSFIGNTTPNVNMVEVIRQQEVLKYPELANKQLVINELHVSTCNSVIPYKVNDVDIVDFDIDLKHDVYSIVFTEAAYVKIYYLWE